MAWLLLPSYGFFSVIRSREDRELVIRARVPQDLDRLRAVTALGATQIDPTRDYLARASAGEREFGRGISTILSSISYSNVKAEVARVDGRGRAAIYEDAWLAFRQLSSLRRPTR